MANYFDVLFVGLKYWKLIDIAHIAVQGWKEWKRMKKNKFKIKMTRKEKIQTALYIALACILVAVLFGILAIKIYVMWEFSDVPISEVPSWAVWWMNAGR